MAIALKRTAAGEEKAEHDQAVQREMDKINRRLLGEEQLAALRAEIHELAPRLAKGLALKAEKGWQWEEPDWEADPETWAPLARLAWLWERMEVAVEAATMLRHLTGHPGWCAPCHVGQPMPEGWSFYRCSLHQPRKLARVRAEALGWAPVEQAA
jgi:hypothetical protein